jgi:LacI family transcriptional regulator
MSEPATLQTVASSLGLSKTTVSVALRGRPGVSEAMRARIIAEAERLGYTPNPVAGELMAMVRSRRQTSSGETIAFINTYQQDPTLLRRIPGLRQIFDGAAEFATHYGYRLEEFRAVDYARSQTRLDQVLKARGIRGVLVGPRWFEEPEVALDWSAYSCVLVGETTYGAGIYRVCNHHPQTMELALTSLVGLGYKRIGIELMSNYESVRHFDFLAGVSPARHNVLRAARFFERFTPRQAVPGIEKVPPEKRDEISRVFDNTHEVPKLAKWIQRERLDALVTLHGYDPNELRRIPTVSGHPLGYARLEVQPEDCCAGVNQHMDDVGRTGMDLLRGLLHAGERGVVPRPRIVLVEGEWVDGPTAPRILP